MADNPVRVLIVDDHFIVRSGLKAFLSIHEDLQQVGEARSGEKALELCALQPVDVVLMDIIMPGMGGIEAIRQIHENYPGTQVIALTSFQDEQMVKDALKAGAIGYLLKDVSSEDLRRAILAAAEGKPSLSPEAARVLMQAAGQSHKLGDDLTEREKEILKCMAAGLTNPEIARQLFVSTGTVKFHVSSILSKLGAASRTEAVALAVQHNLAG